MQLLTAAVLKYVSAGLLAACLIFLGLWQMDKQGAKKWKGRAEYYQGELARISDTKNEQAEVTTKTIERVRVVEREAGRQAEKVENAPVTPGVCETPTAVLEADL